MMRMWWAHQLQWYKSVESDHEIDNNVVVWDHITHRKDFFLDLEAKLSQHQTLGSYRSASDAGSD